jgi:hypothetical protein
VTLDAETFHAVLELRGVTISGLARELGVSRAHLSEALRGLRATRLSYWLAVGRVLGLSHDEVRALLEPLATRRHGHALNSEWRART